MTYQPFLPEAAAGSIEPRHVVVPLRKVLRGCRGPLRGGSPGSTTPTHSVTARLAAGTRSSSATTCWSSLPGSVARTLPIPGLAECGIAFKTVGEAIYLRNHVLDRMDVAATTLDPDVRRRLLTFLVVGGGYAGIEALAEMEDMARYAHPLLPRVRPRRPALGAGRGGRADHARGRARHWAPTRSSSCTRPASRSAWTPGSKSMEGGPSSSTTAPSSTRTRSSGPRA